MTNPGQLFVYSGPSGVGKGTLLRPVLAAEQSKTVLSVSVTTRAPRPGEVEGKDYSFIDRAAFEQLIAEDGLLEYAQYSGNFYGTPRAAVEAQLAQGRNVVLEIEVQGAMQVMAAFPQAVSIFVVPPSAEVLRKRLTDRATEPAQVIERRLETARKELLHAGEYEFLIINDDLETARRQLASIIDAAGCLRRNMQRIIDEVKNYA